jgi:hypothetical protein
VEKTVNLGWPAEFTWYKLLTDWGSLIGGGFALIAGAALYIIGRVQANTVKKQTEVLKQQVTAAEDTAERQLRAYVGITSGNVTLDFANHSPRLLAMLKMQNGGQTPAYKVRGKGGIKSGAAFENTWLEQTKPFAENTMLIPNAEFAYRLAGTCHEPTSVETDAAQDPTGYNDGQVKWESDGLRQSPSTSIRFGALLSSI